jgi:hypothetical protein
MGQLLGRGGAEDILPELLLLQEFQCFQAGGWIPIVFVRLSRANADAGTRMRIVLSARCVGAEPFLLLLLFFSPHFSLPFSSCFICCKLFPKGEGRG